MNKYEIEILDGDFKSYLDLENISQDAFIYRIFPINRLYQMYNEGKNTLVSPKLWDDPYENFVLEAQVALSSGETMRYGFKNQYYGQCWTLRTYSDAMWRIYSQDHRSVRVRTTIRKLAYSLALHHPNTRNDACFIGKVKYMKNDELADLASAIGSLAVPTSSSYAKTLLRKRRAFSHEKEVRLIYSDVSETNNGDIYKYDISPHELFDQIMIDPRIDHEEFIDIENAIRRRTKFSGEIVRSELYDPPPRIFNAK